MEVGGGVWVISAERELGKSLRRMRVREMWWFWGWVEVEVEVEVEAWSLGVKAKVQASFGRKSWAEVEVAVDDMEACWGLTRLCRGEGLDGLLRVWEMRSS